MNRLLLTTWFAACTPGTGFDDLPAAPGDGTNPDGDADTDADSDADTDVDTDTDSDADSDTDTGGSTATTATTGTTADTGLPTAGLATINEILADPPASLPGDANCDGTRDPIADAFVEIVNVGAIPLDLGTAVLASSSAMSHTFAAGEVLDPGETVVVFGGGTLTFDGSGTSGPWCAALPTEVRVEVSSAGDLGLASAGDTLTLSDRYGRTLDTVTWGAEAQDDQSVNRSPELSSFAPLVEHGTVPSAIGAFSPGTLVDGSAIVLEPFDTSDTGVPVVAVQATIGEVQGGIHPVGTEVEVQGITTAVGDDGLYFEAVGGGPSSGVWVALGAGFTATWGPIAEGDALVVVGQVQEPVGTTVIDVLGSAIPSVAVTGAGTVPDPLVTTVPALLADPEPWEGVLVEIVDVVVSDPIVAGNEFDVTDFAATGTIGVDDQLSLYSGYAALVDGDRFDAIRGPLASDGGRFRIEPRRDADLEDALLPELRINEILADPPSRFGDANCDGIADGSDDDFVELWNVGGADADLTGLTVADDSVVRHVFPPGTVIPAGDSITVFGGGTPIFDGTGTGGTWCTASGVLVQTASTGSLGLTNGGDAVTVASGSRLIETATFGSEVNDDHSINRDPDLSTNALVRHDLVFGAVNDFSPGTPVDGVPVPYRATIAIDGDPADFPGDSAFATSASTVSHVAWDASRLWVSLAHPSIAGGADQWVVAYLGNGSGGTTTGFPIGIQQPDLPFAASYAVRWAADGSTNGLLVWDGAGWVETVGRLGTVGSDVADDDLLETVELAIPFDEVGVTSELDLVVTMVSDTLGFETTAAATPNTAIVNDTRDPDYTRYFHFNPNLDTPPSGYAPVP